jgi:hypothetical protein
MLSKLFSYFLLFTNIVGSTFGSSVRNSECEYESEPGGKLIVERIRVRWRNLRGPDLNPG